MGSSPGFGSARRSHPGVPCGNPSGRPVRTRFRSSCAPPRSLGGTTSNSPAHSSIGTPSPVLGTPEGGPGIGLWLTVGRRFQELFHSPRRGTFHLSLTVLVHYRSQDVFSLGAWSPQLPTGFLVSRGTHGQHPTSGGAVAYGALTPCGGPSQVLRLAPPFLTRREPCGVLQCAVQPRPA